jgi:rubrerythrin|tara:strand:+ start:620 stop:1036 length:417 start_codon:yes stop_codon:yes gene_type:complete
MVVFDEGYFNIESNDNLLAKCKKCGNKAPSKDFQIDDELGVMVCSNCFKNSSFKKNVVKKEQEVEKKPKTIIIDSEHDVFKNVEIQEKKKEVKKDTRKKYICDKCAFPFKYNKEKNWPNVCPACGKSVKEMKSVLDLI